MKTIVVYEGLRFTYSEASYEKILKVNQMWTENDEFQISICLITPLIRMRLLNQYFYNVFDVSLLSIIGFTTAESIRHLTENNV